MHAAVAIKIRASLIEVRNTNPVHVDLRARRIVPQNASYAPDRGEFATARADRAARSSTTPPAASVWRNCWKKVGRIAGFMIATDRTTGPLPSRQRGDFGARIAPG